MESAYGKKKQAQTRDDNNYTTIEKSYGREILSSITLHLRVLSQPYGVPRHSIPSGQKGRHLQEKKSVVYLQLPLSKGLMGQLPPLHEGALT
jgi:hypothetical protein